MVKEKKCSVRRARGGIQGEWCVTGGKVKEGIGRVGGEERRGEERRGEESD
jgi:hypothetical protein